MENKKNNSSKKTTSAKKKSTSSSTKKTTVAKKSTTAAKKTTNVASAKKSSVSKNVKSKTDLKKTREAEKPKVDLIKVENNKKSRKDFEFIKFVLYAVGILFIALGVLFNNTLVDTEVFDLVLGDIVIPVKLIGFLLIGVTGVIQAVRSEKHSLMKSLLIILGMAILGTWIFPNGSISGAEFVDTESYGINFNELVSIAYNGIYMCIDKILVLISIAFFYKIANKTGAYHKLVDKKVKLFKGKEDKYVVGCSVVVILLTSFVTETFAIVFFLPFIISVLSKLKIDKFTAFAVTFGALIVGTIASPYGTEALSGFNYYASLSIDNALVYRFALQACILVLYVVFVNMRLKDVKKEEVVSEGFLIEEAGKKKVNEIPLMVIMIITALFMSVAFIDWSGNFGITMFEEFHAWLFELTIGEYPIFQMLLGDSSSVSVIGAYSIFDGITILLIMSIITIAAYKIKFEEIIESLISVLKFLAKPLIMIGLITAIFTVGYMTQFAVVIGHYLMSLSVDFNPFANALNAAISGIFHSDLAFTGYVYSAYFAERYTAYQDALSITYTSITALIQLIVPTSPILIGLYYTNVSYKKWIKYIGLFVVAVLIVTLLLLTVVTYLG